MYKRLAQGTPNFACRDCGFLFSWINVRRHKARCVPCREERRPEKACADCNATFRSYTAKRCDKCRSARREYMRTGRGAGEAHTAVARAIRHGEIPAPATLACTDCGGQAQQYDHRDYNFPLVVEPVCRPCNLRRGPAIPLKATAQMADDLRDTKSSVAAE